MKILDITSITDASEMPLKKGTLQFLQDANKEIVAATIIALIGPSYNASIVYILSGSINSGVVPFYNITSGAAFFNGEIYLIDATTFTVVGLNTAIFVIGVTQYTTNADPVTFTDAATRNVHNIRKIVVTQGVTGTGIADYSQAFFLSFVIPPVLNLTAPVDTPDVADNAIIVSGAYPNVRIYTPTPPTSAHPILYMGYYNIGNVSAGGQDYAVVFSSSLSTSNYFVVGSLVSQGPNADVDTTLLYTIRAKTNAGFTIHCKEIGAFTQNVGFEYVIIKFS